MKKSLLTILFLLSLSQSIASLVDSTKYRKLNLKKHCISYKKGDTLPFTGIAYKNYLGGKRKRSSKLEYGLSEGKTINYYRNGKIESVEMWKNGSIQSSIRYSKSGKIVLTTEFENGYLSYKTIRYEKNGVKSYEYNINNGNYNGPYKIYHSNGRLSSLMLYENGKKVGIWIYYDEDGKVEYKEHYKDGKRDFTEYLE